MTGPLATRSQPRPDLEPYTDPLERGDALPALSGRVCAWPPCGRVFTARRMIEVYCCGECRRAAGKFRDTYGGPFVDAALDLARSRRTENRGDPAWQKKGRRARTFIQNRGRDLLDHLERLAAERAHEESAHDEH